MRSVTSTLPTPMSSLALALRNAITAFHSGNYGENNVSGSVIWPLCVRIAIECCIGLHCILWKACGNWCNIGGNSNSIKEMQARKRLVSSKPRLPCHSVASRKVVNLSASICIFFM